MRRSAERNDAGRLELVIDNDPPPEPPYPPLETRPFAMLLLEDDPKEQARLLSSIRKTPAEIRCAPSIAAALQLMERDRFDAIMIDRHLGGWVSARTCRDIVLKAGEVPVVGLINEDCVLGLEDGIEAGLRGVYYKDQMDVHLVRRLAGLAKPPNGGRAPATASPAPAAARRSRSRN